MIIDYSIVEFNHYRHTEIARQFVPVALALPKAILWTCALNGLYNNKKRRGNQS
jgi:hypothetical protein